MAYNKHRNIKTEVDGILFDSKIESAMYIDLKLLERGGAIRDLKLQPSFILLTSYIGLDGLRVLPIKYVADFSFYDNDKKRYRVLDAKGKKTEVFKLKEKLFNKQMLDQNIKIEFEL